MKIVSVINQKGGSGKTTVARHLAVGASLAGFNTAVVDLDPQASSARWGDRREAKGPVVRAVHASRLPYELQQIQAAGGDWVVVDTAPHADSAALEAAKVSDLILIPYRPSYFDLEALTTTLGVLRTTGKPVWAVLNAVAPFGAEAAAAEETMTALDVRLCAARLGRRVAFARAVESGQAAQEVEPKSKAAQEAARLYEWVAAAL